MFFDLVRKLVKVIQTKKIVKELRLNIDKQISNEIKDEKKLLSEVKNMMSQGNFFSAKELLNLISEERNSEFYLLLGITERNLGNYDSAKSAFNMGIKIDSQNSDFFSELGNLYFFENQTKTAIFYYEEALSLNPKNYEANLNLALLYRNQGEYQKAKRNLNILTRTYPNQFLPVYNLGFCNDKLGNKDEAKGNYLTAISIDNQNPEAHFALGNIYKDEKDWENAKIQYQIAIENSTPNSRYYSNLGYVFHYTGDFINAEKILKQAVETDPNNLDAKVNLASTLFELDRIEEALLVHDEIISSGENVDIGKFNKSLVLLYAGDYENGFDYYRWRKESAFRNQFADIKQWNGENLNGKSIVILDEQGVGDFFQFSRFVFVLNEIFPTATIKLFVRNQLTDFVRKTNLSKYLCENPSSNFNFTCDLLSLPYFVKNYSAKSDVNYLGITSQKQFENSNLKKIGIVWRGNPDHMYDFKRSLKLENILHLFNSNFQFYSLQKEITENEKEMLKNHKIIDLSEQLTDFYQTAEFINSMDLIITVDTAVAHLSGILQKETWLLLPKIPDWRWQQSGDISVWYNKVYLFRQKIAGNWTDVLHEIFLKLNKNGSDFAKIQKKQNAIELIESGKNEEGIRALSEILKENPNDVEVLNLLGFLFLSVDKVKSVEFFEKSLKINFDYGILKEKAKILFDLGIISEAAKIDYLKLVEFEETSEIYNVIGLCFQKEYDFEQAVFYFEKAINLEKKAGYYLNLANNLYYLSRFEEAIKSYSKAIEIENLVSAKIGRSFAYLVTRQFLLGFEDYLFSLDKNIEKTFGKSQKWNGENLIGKSIFIYAEQGIGDSIEFSRFLNYIKDPQTKIIVGVNKATEKLFQTVPFVSKVVTTGVVQTDYFASMLALPNILKLSKTEDFELKDMIFDLSKVEIPSNIYIQKEKRNFGLVLETNSKSPTVAKRIINIETAKKLFEIPNSHFYLLQKEISNELLEFCQNNSQKITIVSADLAEIGKFIEELEAVITIDTAMVHLSASLNNKTYLLLPKPADWRWEFSGEKTYWYSSVEMIRQVVPENWQNVIDELYEKLLEENHLSVAEIRKLLDEKRNEQADLEIKKSLQNPKSDEEAKELYFLGGYVNQLLDKKEEAVKYYTILVTKYDPNVNYLNNLGVVLKDLGEFEKSKKILEIALKLDENSASVLNNLGMVYDLLGDFDSSKICFEKALKINPNYIDALLNFGNLNNSQRNYKDSHKMFDKILELDKENSSAKFNKSLVYLSEKDYKNGFLYYEYRKLRKDFIERRFEKEELNTNEISGKTIFVWDEQGYGDTIQFGRFVNDLHKKGANVILQTHESLAELMQYCEGVQISIGRKTYSEPQEFYDFHIPLLSIPHYLEIDESEITRKKYIHIPRQKIYSKKHLFDETKINVGLVWEGKMPIQNAHRSIPLEQMKEIFVNDNMKFFSLQIGEVAKRDAQLMKQLGIVDLSNEINNFLDTAAITENLDLVITIDTSVAHLVGALGKRGIVLLSAKADWRWESGEKTSWYSSLELVRQTELNKWENVITQINHKLKIQEKDFITLINNKRSYTHGLSY